MCKCFVAVDGDKFAIENDSFKMFRIVGRRSFGTIGPNGRQMNDITPEGTHEFEFILKRKAAGFDSEVGNYKILKYTCGDEEILFKNGRIKSDFDSNNPSFISGSGYYEE